MKLKLSKAFTQSCKVEYKRKKETLQLFSLAALREIKNCNFITIASTLL
jgi:hypothetical protein